MPSSRVVRAFPLLLACARQQLALGAASFLTLGDWGGMALGGFHAQTVTKVADQMGKTGASAGISFVVNTGDNFYHCGIKSTTDFQLKTDFEDVYTAPSLNVPWYSVLGNHEYGHNVEAQIEYKDPLRRWTLDARYYTRRVEVAFGVHISFIFLDTSPCVKKYRSSNPIGWDPCSSAHPTCTPHEGPCEFHSNILSQDCHTQYTWFQNALHQVPAGDWLIVVGHHKINEINEADFLTPLENARFDLYLNGHVHALTQYEVNGNSRYVTSGAGAMVRTKDQEDELEESALNASAVRDVWNKKWAGFTLHTFSENYTQLRTEYIHYTGKTLHSFTVTKNQRGEQSEVVAV